LRSVQNTQGDSFGWLRFPIEALGVSQSLEDAKTILAKQTKVA
jgi:hypothetical protein